MKKIDNLLVLAGGKGTRLRSLVSDVPKPMAPINGLPFLGYLLNFWIGSAIVKKITVSIGYLSEIIESYLLKNYSKQMVDICAEEYPLGTGGAIKAALKTMKNDELVIIVNGDTYANICLEDFLNDWYCLAPDLLIATKYLSENDRYGLVSMDESCKITDFTDCRDKGFVNLGIYLTSVKFLNNEFEKFQEIFSFENEFLAKIVHSKNVKASKQNGFFIDIGIPNDYKKAQEMLANLK